MRCQSSICRWSPFFGIWLSNSTGASGWTRYGANRVASALGRPSMSRFQCASGPSPRHETMPIPVIRTLRAASAIGARLGRELDPVRPFFHAGAELVAGKLHHLEGDVGAADLFFVDRDARLGHRISRAFMNELGGERQQLSGRHEGAQLGILDGGPERHS